MNFRKTMILAAGTSLLTIGMPVVAQDAQTTTDPATTGSSTTPDSTMQDTTPTPPEVPSNPAPAEAPPPPAPPETPAPASPPPAEAEQTPMTPAAPGTTPGQQDTSVTNPPPAAQAVYPPCSRTVTDQCTQREGRATKKRRPR